MNAVIRIKKSLIQATVAIASIALAFMMIIVVTEIVLRQSLGLSTMIATDFVAYGLGITFYWGAAKSFDEGAFVRMDILFDMYKGRFKKYIIILFDLILFYFNCNITYYFGILLHNTIIRDVRAINIYETPLYIPRAIMFAGMILFSLYLICRIIEDLNVPVQKYSNREMRKLDDIKLEENSEAAVDTAEEAETEATKK